MISDYLKEAADFFEQNPKSYTNDWVACRNGQRTTYTNPDADQWDIIGILGKLYWDKEKHSPMPMWMFKRLVQAFREGNQMDLIPQESPLIIFMNDYADTVFDIIAALRRAHKYMMENPSLNDPPDLTPPPPPIPQRRGGFVL